MIKTLAGEALRYSRTLYTMALNDFRTRYAGSYLGIVWAFIQPMVTILVFWFVFEVGLRNTSVKGVPFLIWLVCGLVPWFFFSDAWVSASHSLLEYSYLVKKVVFRVSFLPFVKLLSSSFVHGVFLLILFILCLLFHIPLRFAMLQVFYYSIALACLAMALSLFTTSVLPFFRDLGQIITIVLQFGMWLTPIMWSDALLPPSLHWAIFVNPLNYIVDGYRGAVLRGEWFWQRPYQTLYFWSFVLVAGGFGAFVYRKLRPHFADVL